MPPAALSGDDSGSLNRVQPKSQLEKRVDELERKIASSGSSSSTYGKISVNEKSAQWSVFAPKVEMSVYGTMKIETEESGSEELFQ